MTDTLEPERPPISSIDIVLFSAGVWRVGVEARWVRSSHGAPAEATDNAVEALLGFERTTAAAPTVLRQYLQLKHPDGDIDILVDGPVELLSMPVSAIHALPPLLAARTGLRALQALAFAPSIASQRVILLFNVPGLSANVQ